MKIAFLTTRTEKPSARLRFLQYIPYLEKEGFSIEVMTIPRGFMERMRFFKTLSAFDTVFLQKRLFGFIDWRLLRGAAKKIVYDFDDAVMFNDSAKGNPESSVRMKRFKRTVEESDAVIAGNRYLMEWGLKHNGNTFLVPTAVDTERYREKKGKHEDSCVTLGWIGSGSTLFYLERMRATFDELFERRPNTRLKIVADRFFECGRMPVVKKRWNYGEEAEDLGSFDIGLMPLSDDVWARGKCGFKLLQYMAAGVASVASAVGVNKEIISHGANGFLAGKDSEWLKHLSELVSDRALRDRFGEEARKTVYERYSTAVNAPKVKAVLVGAVEAGLWISP
ncbi:MAG: glycosyltransferase [Deltaproteobacteria bacterium]|nr:glycosyltransferase [Deltaproteobacteria bacterium]